MGAAYVVTGSVNQACVESGTSDVVRAMLADAEATDVAMAPAADMFEMGVKVQVLKRATLFPMRAAKLYELYRTCESLEQIPAKDRTQLETTFFRMPLESAWADTERFFATRDPAQLERAARDPKHRLALTFRSYLGLGSRWATSGDAGRKVDFQVWCGPAMGAFNAWARGSCLEAPPARRVADVAWNVMFGAAVLARRATLVAQGADPERLVVGLAPRSRASLLALLETGREEPKPASRTPCSAGEVNRR
jgi:PfaD family protein